MFISGTKKTKAVNKMECDDVLQNSSDSSSSSSEEDTSSSSSDTSSSESNIFPLMNPLTMHIRYGTPGTQQQQEENHLKHFIETNPMYSSDILPRTGIVNPSFRSPSSSDEEAEWKQEVQTEFKDSFDYSPKTRSFSESESNVQHSPEVKRKLRRLSSEGAVPVGRDVSPSQDLFIYGGDLSHYFDSLTGGGPEFESLHSEDKQSDFTSCHEQIMQNVDVLPTLTEEEEGLDTSFTGPELIIIEESEETGKDGVCKSSDDDDSDKLLTMFDDVELKIVEKDEEQDIQAETPLRKGADFKPADVLEHTTDMKNILNDIRAGYLHLYNILGAELDVMANDVPPGTQRQSSAERERVIEKIGHDLQQVITYNNSDKRLKKMTDKIQAVITHASAVNSPEEERDIAHDIEELDKTIGDDIKEILEKSQNLEELLSSNYDVTEQENIMKLSRLESNMVGRNQNDTDIQTENNKRDLTSINLQSTANSDALKIVPSLHNARLSSPISSLDRLEKNGLKSQQYEEAETGRHNKQKPVPLDLYALSNKETCTRLLDPAPASQILHEKNEKQKRAQPRMGISDLEAQHGSDVGHSNIPCSPASTGLAHLNSTEISPIPCDGSFAGSPRIKTVPNLGTPLRYHERPFNVPVEPVSATKSTTSVAKANIVPLTIKVSSASKNGKEIISSSPLSSTRIGSIITDDDVSISKRKRIRFKSKDEDSLTDSTREKAQSGHSILKNSNADITQKMSDVTKNNHSFSSNNDVLTPTDSSPFYSLSPIVIQKSSKSHFKKQICSEPKIKLKNGHVAKNFMDTSLRNRSKVSVSDYYPSPWTKPQNDQNLSSSTGSLTG